MQFSGMPGPLRDPFRRPGVADEFEAQLQMQEERRIEAGRLANAEAEIARLRSNVRRGIFAVGALAVVIALVVAAFFAGLFPRRPAKPVTSPPDPVSQDSPRISRAPMVASSKTGLPRTIRNPEDTMPQRVPSVSVRNIADGTASAPKPPSEVAPVAPPPSFSAPTPPRENVQPVNPVVPVLPSGLVPISNEYQIKAAFLPHFADSVKWPAEASAPAKEVFTVGILGNDPFGNTLDRVFQDRPVHGLKVVIRRSRDAADLRGAQMVFISKSERAKIQEILLSFAGTSTLTIGETEEFTALGGMIEFIFVGEHIKFRTNRRAAREAGLEMDSRLSKLAVP